MLLTPSLVQVQRERDELYDRFVKAIHEVQQKSGLKNILLEKKLSTLADALEKKVHTYAHTCVCYARTAVCMSEGERRHAHSSWHAVRDVYHVSFVLGSVNVSHLLCSADSLYNLHTTVLAKFCVTLVAFAAFESIICEKIRNPVLRTYVRT